MNAVRLLLQCLGSAAFLLLCQCAVKHQPQEFAPSFRLKAPQYTADHLWERRELQKNRQKSRLEQRRLLDLYRQELAVLHPDHPLRGDLVEEVEYLEAELAPLLQELSDLRKANRAARRNKSSRKRSGRIRVTTPIIKETYEKARELWNDDVNAEALALLDRIVSDPKLAEDADEKEWFQVHYIRFRVALDVGDYRRQRQSYEKMLAIDDCHEKTAVTGFLMALGHFVHKEPKKAAETLESQCDPDDSLTHQLRKQYWLGRFREDPNDPAQSYGSLLRFPIPGYYQYLALTRTQKKMVFPRAMFEGRSFLKRPLEVSAFVARRWKEAEERLHAGLHRDAALYLRSAFHELIGEGDDADEVAAMLYTAHLLQAAGDQLPAMQLYGRIMDQYYKGEITVEDYPVDFLGEMFPRPFEEPVDALTRQWSVDPDLVYSLMRQESAFNPQAVSVAGARGLLQMMPFLAEHLADQWGDQDYRPSLLFDGEENLKWAVFHLHQLHEAAPHLALIASSYNAGIARVRGWWQRFGHLPLDVFVELIPVAETRKYVKLVMRNYLYYRSGRSERVVRGGWVPFTLPPYQYGDARIGD